VNIAVVYYSYSGNTHKAAKVVEEILKSQNNSVKCLRIEAPNESRSFFIQVLRALSKRKGEIAPIETDLLAYDLIIFATPVWAREMAPAMRAYLEKAGGLGGKKTIAFVTYGSGFSKERCLDSLQFAIQEKGASVIGLFSVSQFKVNDKSLIEGLLRKAMDIANKPLSSFGPS